MKRKLSCFMLIGAMLLAMLMPTVLGTEIVAEDDPVKVELWCMHPEDQEETSVFQRLKSLEEKFNEENDQNIVLEISGAKTADVIMTTIASGSHPDIFQNYWNNAPTWANNGALYDMTEFVENDEEWNKDDFLEEVWDVCTYDNKIYSIPMTLSTTLMAYRTDILAECGWDKIPQNLDEFIQAVEDTTVVAEDGSIERAGLVPDMPWLDNVLWPAAFGAEWMDGDQPYFNHERMIEAYQFQADIYDELGYTELRRFVDSFGQQASPEDPLFKGQVAMSFCLDNWLANYEEFAPEDIEWTIAPMPMAEDGSGGQMMTAGVWEMNAKTENPEKTWAALSFLTNEESLKETAKGDHNYGTFMPRKSALNFLIEEHDSSEAVKKVAQILLDEDLISFPMLDYTGEYLTVIGDEMSAALAGEISVEEAAENVQAEVEALAE